MSVVAFSHLRENGNANNSVCMKNHFENVIVSLSDIAILASVVDLKVPNDILKTFVGVNILYQNNECIPNTIS